MTPYLEATGAGPALVLLHGFTGDARAWDAHRAAFAASHHVVTLDLPGHGRSAAPVAASGLPEAADLIAARVAAHGVERAAVLGYSLGGRVALHMALRHPSLVERLVLESTSPGIADPQARAARAAADDALADAIVSGGLEAFVTRWLAQPLFATQARLPAPVRAAERTRRLAQQPEALAGALRAFSVGRQTPLHDRLPALRMPVLLLAGADDTTYCDHARAMAARLPDVRLEIVPDAGHTTHLENPEAFRAAVLGFTAARGRRATASATQ